MHDDTYFVLPPQVQALWKAQQTLAKHYEHTGLKFTLDGRLVGDIAEAIAREHFELAYPPKRTGGVDATTKDGKSVQIKATGNPKSGPAFSWGTGYADHLLFFQIDFEQGTAHLLYNGPEKPVRAFLGTEKWANTRSVSLKNTHEVATRLSPAEMISRSDHRSEIR